MKKLVNDDDILNLYWKSEGTLFFPEGYKHGKRSLENMVLLEVGRVVEKSKDEAKEDVERAWYRYFSHKDLERLLGDLYLINSREQVVVRSVNLIMVVEEFLNRYGQVTELKKSKYYRQLKRRGKNHYRENMILPFVALADMVTEYCKDEYQQIWRYNDEFDEDDTDNMSYDCWEFYAMSHDAAQNCFVTSREPYIDDIFLDLDSYFKKRKPVYDLSTITDESEQSWCMLWTRNLKNDYWRMYYVLLLKQMWSRHVQPYDLKWQRLIRPETDIFDKWYNSIWKFLKSKDYLINIWNIQHNWED